jgi:hypothetical protein
MWANEFDNTPENNPRFDDRYHANEPIARALVNRAIDDWNNVVLDQNWDNDDTPETTPDLQLRIVATDLFGSRGGTVITDFTDPYPV